MLKKTIKYKDFNDEEVEEDFYFHLSKAEIVELEMSVDGGLSESLKKIVASEDTKMIIAEFKKIILMSYGQRSDDGRFFRKTQELRDEFESSEAYSTLFMELLTDMTAAIEFINGIVPTGLMEEAAAVIAQQETQPQLEAVPDAIPDNPEPEVITKAELNQMSGEDLVTISERVAKGEVKIAE